MMKIGTDNPEDRKPKVVVAMSGGVDSSVAACLLREQGYEVMGLFMRTGVTADDEASSDEGRAHRGCCSAVDAADARFVAGTLGVPFYALDFERDFDRIIDYFVDEYAAGRTPNPCVVCNNDLKFGKILDYADAVGAQFIATGHYARIEHAQGQARLLRAVDAEKDQSYVLFGIDASALDRLLFPIGGMNKDEVRQHANRFNLTVCDKPDSMDICFVPDRDYASLVRRRRPQAFVPGNVIDEDGQVVGTHDGLPNYTVGQRRGLGIAAGHPIYVASLNVLDNTVSVGPRDAIMRRQFTVRGLNFLNQPKTDRFKCDTQIRYHHAAAAAMVEHLGNGSARVIFDAPQSAITPGQAAVFYDGDEVVGGGWIEKVADLAPTNA